MPLVSCFLSSCTTWAEIDNHKAHHARLLLTDRGRRVLMGARTRMCVHACVCLCMHVCVCMLSRLYDARNWINFWRLLLLNELSVCPQLGLILKSCACSLKWAQVEVKSSICSGAKSSQNCNSFCYYTSNNINFKRPSLLNKLRFWPQLGLILKSCVCCVCWGQKLNPFRRYELSKL